MLDPTGFDLPPIPPKRYFAIGEVSRLCATKPHVLRYWESVFPQLKPVKRRGRRYYQRHEVKLIRHIRRMLYTEGFTINGARARLEQLAGNNPEAGDIAVTDTQQGTSKIISQLIEELSEVQKILG